MLIVTALEFRHPVVFVVLIKTDDALVHFGRASGSAAFAATFLRLARYCR